MHSHFAGFLFTSACIKRTCGAAISTGPSMDVEPTPALRWVQLKADATPANGVCVCVRHWKDELYTHTHEEERGAAVAAIRWEPMRVELL